MYMYRAIESFIQVRILLDNWNANQDIIDNNQKILNILFHKVWSEYGDWGIQQILNKLKLQYVIKDSSFIVESKYNTITVVLEPAMQKAITIIIVTDFCTNDDIERMWSNVLN